MVLRVALSLVMAAIGSCPKINLIGRGEGRKNSQKGLSVVVVLLTINASIYVLWPDIMWKFSLFGFWRKALWSLPYGLLRAWTVHLRWLTALIEVKTQNLLKVEACITQPRLLLFCPLFPNSLLYPMDYTVIRHLVLMSFPYGCCSITFTVAVSGLQIHISFCFLAHGWMDAYLHKHMESRSKWSGQQSCQTGRNLSTLSFLSRRPSEKKRQKKSQ